MKKFLYFFFVLAFFPMMTFSQGRGERFKEAREKIEQLEKIKLIEILKMDEKTTLKFFARRTEFMDNLKDINKKQDVLLEKLDDAINSNKNKDDSYYQGMIDQYFNLEQQIFEARKSFITSLSDILTKEQIAKLLVFQKKFREEVRDILFRHGAGAPPGPPKH
jgi:hypothetical protein